MKFQKSIKNPSIYLVALLAAGCGGGSGGGATGGGTTSHPTTQTVTDVTNAIGAYGQSAVGISFRGFGAKLRKTNQAVLDPVLGLYGVMQVSPDTVVELLYVDQAETMPAGSLRYTLSDAAQDFTGPISVTAGPYSGVTGTYLQVVQSSPLGYNGNISYTAANGVTTSTEYAVQLQEATGQTNGTATTSYTNQAGTYIQTETIVYNLDGSWTLSSTDGSDSLKGSLSFTATNSGSGTITGTDPGLPAKIAWTSSGSGSVTYKDGTLATITNWVYQP